MASTDQVRGWYHETVSNHAERGSPGYEPKCHWHIAKFVEFPAEDGGTYAEPVHPATAEAFAAYAAAMYHHGETMPVNGGVNNCRNIGDSNWPSLHAYLVAIDLPPNKRKTDAFIAGIEGIRTNSGARVFRNLAGDRMHDQIDCSPADLATGINWHTVPGSEEEDMPTSEEIAQATVAELLATPVWQTNVNVAQLLSRNYRNINELLVAHRAGTLGTTAMTELDDDDLMAIAIAVADEQHRRLAA